MRVRIIKARIGPDGAWYPGDLRDLPDTQARRLLAIGAVEAVEEPAPESTMAAPLREVAMRPPAQPRRK